MHGLYRPVMNPHPHKQILCLVHGDDLVSVGCPEQLRWLKETLTRRLEIKTTTVGRRESEGELEEARILNRVIRVTKDGWEYEADQRRVDLIMQETGAAKMSTLTHTQEGTKRWWEGRKSRWS